MLLRGPIGGKFDDPRAWVAFLIYAAVPAIAWRYLRTINEFLIGVPLLIACAYSTMGGALGFWNQPQVALYALVLAAGTVEHRQFQVLVA